jgi:hypothetical protein
MTLSIATFRLTIKKFDTVKLCSALGAECSVFVVMMSVVVRIARVLHYTWHLALEACQGQTHQPIGSIRTLQSNLNTDPVLRLCTVPHTLAYCCAELIMTVKKFWAPGCI